MSDWKVKTQGVTGLVPLEEKKTDLRYNTLKRQGQRDKYGEMNVINIRILGGLRY